MREAPSPAATGWGRYKAKLKRNHAMQHHDNTTENEALRNRAPGTINFSNRLADCRSRLLDAEALLNHLHKAENLNNLLENDSPEVTLGAMIDKAWHLVGEACGDSEHLCDAHDDEVRAEVKSIATEIHDAIRQPENAGPNAYAQHIDTIDEIHEQSRSMLCMLMLYLSQAREGGETLSESMLENYTWQLLANMERAIEASCALSENLRKGAAQ